MTLNGHTALYCTNNASFRAQHVTFKVVANIIMWCGVINCHTGYPVM